MFDDFSDWGATIPHEMNAAVIDAENDQVLNGDGEGANMLGLLHQPDVQTRVCPTITDVTQYSQIDCLAQAVTDIRVAPGSYTEADLIVMHPFQWDEIRRIKNSLGSFVLAADRAMQVGEVDNVMGIPVALTTKCPFGTAVMDTKIAVLAFLRTGLEIMFNPYGTWAFTHNAVQWRAEIRETIGVAYPKAIDIVTNLHQSDGS